MATGEQKELQDNLKDLSFDSSVQINVSRHHSTICSIRPILDVTFAVFDQEVNEG